MPIGTQARKSLRNGRLLASDVSPEAPDKLSQVSHKCVICLTTGTACAHSDASDAQALCAVTASGRYSPSPRCLLEASQCFATMAFISPVRLTIDSNSLNCARQRSRLCRGRCVL